MFFKDDNPVPETFWSFETSEIFRTCSLCGSSLTDEGNQYLIEKAYKKDEVIFEYAMCFLCRTQAMEDLSVLSLKRIAHYFEEHVDFEARWQHLKDQEKSNLDAWLSHCLIKGTPIKESPEHHICGHFMDLNLLQDVLPFALSQEAIEEIAGLLSKETLGIMEDLSDKLFGINLPNNILIL
jgi:hypothetical protein